jgi:hypothetical protein
MKGPGVRVDQDVRRFWRCPLCGKVTRTAGRVTTVVCLCTGEPRWMQLEPTPRRPRYVPPPRELEPVEEYILPPDPPRAKAPVAVTETGEAPSPAPFGDGLELLAAESGLVIETEFRSELVGDGAAESTSRGGSEAPPDKRGTDERTTGERGTGERRPPRGPRPPRGESRERPPRPGRGGGGRGPGGVETGGSGASGGERGRGGAAQTRGPRRPDRPGSAARRDAGGSGVPPETRHGDAQPLSSSPPTGGEAAGSSPAGPAVAGAGSETGSPETGSLGTGSSGTGRRRRRGRQRDVPSQLGAGGPANAAHPDLPSEAPPLPTKGPSNRGSSPGRGKTVVRSVEGAGPDANPAEGEVSSELSESSEGTETGRGRRSRRRRRGGRGPQGNDAPPSGHPAQESPPESFGEGVD